MYRVLVVENLTSGGLGYGGALIRQNKNEENENKKGILGDRFGVMHTERK